MFRVVSNDPVFMRISIMQPGYLPWLGWFERVIKSDCVVIFDTAQYVRQDFMNRNRIRHGDEWKWLSLPVLAHDYPDIRDVLVDNREYWVEAHCGLLRHCYQQTKWFLDLERDLFRILRSTMLDRLVWLQMEIIRLHCSWLGITPNFIMASALECERKVPRNKGTLRLLDICLEMGALTYYTGDASRGYLEESAFAEHDIIVEWQNWTNPVYPQIGNGFMPQMCALDLLMNVGTYYARDLLANGWSNGLPVVKNPQLINACN